MDADSAASQATEVSVGVSNCSPTDFRIARGKADIPRAARSVRVGTGISRCLERVCL